MKDPTQIYGELKDDLQRVLAMPLQGQTERFREFLVGYLVVKQGYSEARARRLVGRNEKMVLLMLTDENER